MAGKLEAVTTRLSIKMTTTLERILDKYNIKIDRQYIVDIPNMGRDDMASLFCELGFNKGAEVGVERGYYSEVLLKANKDLSLYCIDPWMSGAYEPGIDAVDKEQIKFDERFEEAQALLSKYKGVNIVRKTSIEALDDFEDDSLDFVYIDANHDFPNFVNDLHGWKKKVRIGGIVSGHDYALFSYKKFNHVKRSLQAYARCYRMQPLFIVGAEEYKDGTVRDKYRSWFWVKDK